MAQMAPSIWLPIFIFFNTFITFMIIMNFFFYLPSPTKLLKQFLKIFPSWKW